MLIPCYDHAAKLGNVLERLAPLGLSGIVVDDGSCESDRRLIASLVAERPWLTLVRHPSNRGRGAALRTGYALAHEHGFTHVLQIDADGQHEEADVPALLAEATRDPKALILGEPRFDASAPASRRYGRWISRVWVWIETLSFAVSDPLCGLRCLPLEPMLALFARRSCGDGMEFDTELVVRLVWAGSRVKNVPVRVRYFEGGLSHFHLLRDNLRISWLHARLVFALLARALGRTEV